MNIDEAIIVEVAKTIFSRATKVAYEVDETRARNKMRMKQKSRDTFVFRLYSAFVVMGIPSFDQSDLQQETSMLL